MVAASVTRHMKSACQPAVAVLPSFTARLAAAVLWLDVLSDGVPMRWAPLRTVFAQCGQGLRRKLQQ